MDRVNRFLESKQFLNFYGQLWSILLILALLASIVTIWKIFVMLIKSHKIEKLIEKIYHSAGMKDIRHFHKRALKGLGIKIDDKHYEKN